MPGHSLPSGIGRHSESEVTAKLAARFPGARRVYAGLGRDHVWNTRSRYGRSDGLSTRWSQLYDRL